MSYFSEKIKLLRAQNGYTQKQVADEIGISQGNYSGLENGKYEPSLAALTALSDFYDEFIDTLVRPIRIVEDTELTESERIILRKYNRLNYRDQSEIERIIDMKIESAKKSDLD